jgi:hypothetical protein
MIYAIGMFGFLKMRLQLGRFVANGRNKADHGQYVWQTLEEAIDAAGDCNQRNLDNCPGSQQKLGKNSSWVVVGVNADWDKDTVIANDKCPFPTANELLYDREFVELQKSFPFAEEKAEQPF